nr:hypothetical protein [Tanacetum cinerariifolium]
PEHVDDEIIAEDQPYAKDASPIAQSPEYVLESDFEAHPEDDDDEDPEEDPTTCYVFSTSITIIPLVFTPPRIPFPPLPPILSPPSPVLSPAPPPSPIRSLGYRAAMIRLRDEAASTSSPPLQLPSASRREDRPGVTLPPQKRLDASDLVRGEVMSLRTTVLGQMSKIKELQAADRKRQTVILELLRTDHRRFTEVMELRTALQGQVRESSSAAARLAGGLRANYGFVATMDREIMRDPERGLMETEARMSREAWVRATDASDLVHGEVMSLRTTVLAQMSEIRELQAADRRRRRSTEISKLRTALQGQVTALQGQVTALIFRNLTGIVFSYDQKQMAPRRTTRSTADQEIVNATTVTNAQLQTMIDQGVTAALAACDALRSTNGDDSHNSRTGVRRTKRAARECTYTDFIKCQPLPFKGTEGTVGHDAAYGMSWKTLMKMMTDKYFPRNDIRKLEMELCELKVMGTDLARYTQRFQELALLCGRMFSKESDKVEKYVGSLFDMIHVSVVASKPKTMQEAIEIATELMDKKIRTFAERETASKRKFENTSRTTQNQQQQQSNKRQNTGRVYTSASGKKKQYGGSRPLCAKCNYHHDGPCAPKCCNCNKFGHATRDCRNTANTNNANNQRGTELGQKPTRGRNNAPARVYAVGCAGTDPDANVITGKFLLNNRYASILFDTGADRSFVSTTFSTQINVTLSTLDHCYDVELADERIIGLNTILRGCTLNLLNHQFNIDLMPVEREKYVKKGFPIFLAHITTKEVEDKSQKKRHEDVPIVRDFPELLSASRREERPEVTLPPRKRLDIALGPRYEVGESSSAAAARPAGGFRADYGFGAPVSTDTELGGYVREFESSVRQDMDEIYTRLDDEQTERQLLAGRLNMLFMDRRAHAHTRLLMEAEARMSREAWTRAIDASDLIHGEVISLR